MSSGNDSDYRQVLRLLKSQIKDESLIRGYNSLWSASFGRRKEMLFIMMGLGLALAFGGLNAPLLSFEYSISIAGLIVLALAYIGLIPVFATQTAVVNSPSIAVEFMRKYSVIDVQDFPKKLLAFIDERRESEDSTWQNVIAFDLLFGFGVKNIMWVLPLLGLLIVGIVVVVLELLLGSLFAL